MNNKEDIKIILGDAAYPKSEALIVPANTVGIMNRGILNKIIKDGWKKIENEAKKITKETEYKIGDCFITGPGRLKRRGLKKIYHSIIKRLPSDFTSITIIQKSLKVVLKQVVEDKMKSVTICGLGIDPGDLDVYSVASATVNICNKYIDKIEIKIIDNNVEFISSIERIIKNGK